MEYLGVFENRDWPRGRGLLAAQFYAADFGNQQKSRSRIAILGLNWSAVTGTWTLPVFPLPFDAARQHPLPSAKYIIQRLLDAFQPPIQSMSNPSSLS